MAFSFLEDMLVVRIVAFKGQHRITIPKDLAESKKWKPGTKLRFIELPDGSILLKEAEAEDNAEH